jgi:hypothetical protein
MAALPLRFESKITRQDSGCWEWTACKIKTGYGRVQMKEGPKLAHRIIYELLVGPIPEGLTLDHLCRNRSCVNPSHLEPVTMRENCLRGTGPTAINARKTHCIRGHILLLKGKQRICKECPAEFSSSYREKHRTDGPSNPRTHCMRGHEYTPENTQHHHGHQTCRACAKIRMDKFKERHAL